MNAGVLLQYGHPLFTLNNRPFHFDPFNFYKCWRPHLMTAKLQPSTLQEFINITATALDMAIIELKAGDSQLCLDTLLSLNSLLLEISGNDPGKCSLTFHKTG
jgi:hypothetical protein